jgi:hypothetical protein
VVIILFDKENDRGGRKKKNVGLQGNKEMSEEETEE